VTQRQLKQHGMAQPCEADWQCEADGVTPVPSFEKQMLSSMCGEPGCLPAVVTALKSNRLTMKGGHEMLGICSSLASMGGDNASPGEVNKLLLRGDKEEKVCKETHCKDEQTKVNWCAMDEHRLNSCYVHCCAESSCFPGEATTIVQGQGKVPLTKLKTGDHVLVKSRGQLAYEPVLAFLHAMRAPGETMPFVAVTHENGEFRASATHIVFVSSGFEDDGWTSKLVGDLKVGDQVFIANEAVALGASDSIRPSIVVAIGHGTTQSGMYAPLTASGTIIVDGVVASNYASSAVDKSLPHSLAHAFLFPLRLYHRTGLAAAFRPLWQSLCNSRDASKKWLCQGGHLGDGDAGTEAHQMHPYVRLMWKGFKLDLLLLSA